MNCQVANSKEIGKRETSGGTDMEELIKYIEQARANAHATELDARKLGHPEGVKYWLGQQDMARLILAKIKRRRQENDPTNKT